MVGLVSVLLLVAASVFVEFVSTDRDWVEPTEPDVRRTADFLVSVAFRFRVCLVAIWVVPPMDE